MSDTYDPYLDIAVEIRVSVLNLCLNACFFFFKSGVSRIHVRDVSLLCVNFSFFLLLSHLQQAANIVRALELFVKPDVLSGENAYMCAK